MDELNEIRKRKLEEYEKQYMKRGKNMEDKWPNAPIHVTDSDIDVTIKKFDTLVVDCWAPWCGPCNIIAPVIEDLARELQGKIAFAKLNVDNNQGTSMKYQIMSIPTLLVFKNGNLVDRLVGALPKAELKKKLNTY